MFIEHALCLLGHVQKAMSSAKVASVFTKRSVYNLSARATYEQDEAISFVRNADLLNLPNGRTGEPFLDELQYGRYANGTWQSAQRRGLFVYDETHQNVRNKLLGSF